MSMGYDSNVSTETSQHAVGTGRVPETLAAAKRLHAYLLRRHWREDRLVGPDSGVRFNYRAGRYLKSYLQFIPWRDAQYYLQAQGYWTLSNWRLSELDGAQGFAEAARRCTDSTLAAQRSDGAWDYPNPAWRGRVTAYEGVWAALGLLETYRRTGNSAALDGAIRWHTFLTREIGFQEFDGTLAANYFAGRSACAVPNASTDVLRFLAELADASGSSEYREPCARLLEFLERVQEPTGELPYEVSTETNQSRMEHFQCYQYNAFECLGLMRYLRLTADERAHPVIERTLRFLASGVAPDGYARYACGRTSRRVTYHAAALAACFAEATRLGIVGYEDLGQRTYRWVLERQRGDGSFPHSSRDYRVLSDKRSYPRNLAMILYHLLSAMDGGGHSRTAVSAT